MTTEFETKTDYRSTPGFDEAEQEARRMGEGGPIDDFIERMAERVGGKASVKAVFGDPIERDGITVIPVAKVRWGFGGGSGRGPVPVGPGRPGEAAEAAGAMGSAAADQLGSAMGGGGGLTADPIGYLEIGGPDGARFRPITPSMPSPAFMLAAGITAFLALSGLAKLLRR